MSVEWRHTWFTTGGITESSMTFGPAVGGEPTIRLAVGDQEALLSLDDLGDLLLVGDRLRVRGHEAVRKLRTEEESR